MKKVISGMAAVLLMAALFVSPDLYAQQEGKSEGIQWLSMEEAQELAKKEPRKVIVDVYTDWCGWCKKMDKTTFADEKVAAYVNEHFYAVKLKADSNDKVTFKGQEFTNGELARALRVSGYPTIVFFDETFSRFQPVSGFRQAEEFKKILEAFKDSEAQAGK